MHYQANIMKFSEMKHCIYMLPGLYCEVNIDDCMDNKCTHSEKCLDGINNYTCACFPGYVFQFHSVFSCRQVLLLKCLRNVKNVLKIVKMLT